MVYLIDNTDPVLFGTIHSYIGSCRGNVKESGNLGFVNINPRTFVTRVEHVQVFGNTVTWRGDLFEYEHEPGDWSVGVWKVNSLVLLERELFGQQLRQESK